MEIVREVNGKQTTFRLTGTELWKAFEEARRRLCRDDIEDMLSCLTEDEFRFYGCTRKEFDSVMEFMIDCMIEDMVENSNGWQWARDYAIDEGVKKIKAERNDSV